MKRFEVLTLVALCGLAGCRGAVSSLPAGGSPVAGDAQSMAPLARGIAAKAPRRTTPFAATGTSNTVTADMPVPRPDTTPCVVKLFTHYTFTNFNNQQFSYKPPSACKGPWAKVVFNFNAAVSKGVQYDRTAIIWVDGAIVYFGTTAEPSPNLAPHWHVERDVTDLSALFKGASTGQVQLWNCYCPPNYTGIQQGTAFLQFYPPDKQYPAPPVPNKVIGIPYSPPYGNVATLPQNAMQISSTLPRNVVHAYLDLYLQSQADEEQWFMCVPTNVWTKSKNALGFCQNTAFREGEVSVDGTPAGTAPVYPWIYTGGIDPYLWFPIPGVQTLEFVPYRVDLSPFAAVLSNGATQTIGVTVDKAYDSFSGAGDLLLYLDNKSTTVTGKVTENTLSATPPLRIVNKIAYGSGTGLFGGPTATGSVNTSSRRNYTIEGYVNTSAGRVTTTVTVSSAFSNRQNFTYTPSEYVQLVLQDTQFKSTSSTLAGTDVTTTTQSYDYPLSVSYPILPLGKARFQLPILVYQGYQLKTAAKSGTSSVSSETGNTVESKDTMIFNSKFSWTGVKNGASSQLYTYKDPNTCYGKSIASKNNAVTTVSRPGCDASPPPEPSPKP